MHIALYASTTGNRPIVTFTAPIVPRSGELLQLEGCIFKVVGVRYNLVHEICNQVDIDVTPDNDSARQLIGKMLISA